MSWIWDNALCSDGVEEVGVRAWNGGLVMVLV